MKSEIQNTPLEMKNLLTSKHYENVKWGFGDEKKTIYFSLSSRQKELIHWDESNLYFILDEGGIKDTFNEKNIHLVNESLFFNLQKNSLNIIYPIEWDSKKLVGITGTNGKTSVANFAEQLLNLNSIKAFSIGTLGVRSNNKDIDHINGMTTPGMIALHLCLFKHFKNHDVAVIEVSSHGVALRRIWGLEFDIVCWTNFTQDHLDFHKTIDDYFEAKCLFFEKYVKADEKRFVSDSDPELLKKLEGKKFSISKPLKESNFKCLSQNINNGFNLKNIELTTLILSEFTTELKGLDTLQSVAGRFEVIKKETQVFIVDYAHTPDALKNVLESARKSFPDKELHVLFGCGGDRDISKRSQMGTVADNLADKIYLTNDNPRTEDPIGIIENIKEGIKNKDITVVHDRGSAIKCSMENLPTTGCLVIAGKGHEDYQIIGTEKRYFSDVDTVNEIINEGK